MHANRLKNPNAVPQGATAHTTSSTQASIRGSHDKAQDISWSATLLLGAACTNNNLGVLGKGFMFNLFQQESLVELFSLLYQLQLRQSLVDYLENGLCALFFRYIECQ